MPFMRVRLIVLAAIAASLAVVALVRSLPASAVTPSDADVNSDGIVDGRDLYGAAHQRNEDTDVNGDGVTNSADLGWIAHYYGERPGLTTPTATAPASGLRLLLIGDASEAYTVRADVPEAWGSVRVAFEVDGGYFRTERYEPHFLFGDDGIGPWLDTLGPGTHTVVARAYRASDGSELGSATMTVGGAPPPPAPTPTATFSVTATATHTSTPTPTQALATATST
ncbi:MAG TPA: hypothetical protein VNM91_10910, partial [Dehalococcoidia bacterium]|nr:hypothetical protein [Dehalococcoidia bacterium]